MWNLINRTCGRGREKASLPALLVHQGGTVDTPSGVADVLNRHFAAVGRDTVADLNIPADISQRIISQLGIPHGSFTIGSIEPEDVVEALSGIRAGWSTGVAGIPDKILVAGSIGIAVPLAKIFSLSVKLGVFPRRLRDAKVVPIFKRKGSKDNPANYRPISLIDVISKAFEKIVK